MFDSRVSYIYYVSYHIDGVGFLILSGCTLQLFLTNQFYKCSGTYYRTHVVFEYDTF